MKPDLLALLKTLQLSLENGKSITNALMLMQGITKDKSEQRTYAQITKAIQEGASFSKSIQKHLSPSPDIIQFISMAEKGGSFVKTLKSVVNYLEIKNKFYQESSDKIALPLIYFTLTSVIVIGIRFFAIPFHLKEASTYDPKIQVIIADHLQTAQNLSDLLFGLLVLFTIYFFIVMVALFNYTGALQGLAKQYASLLPISSRIISYFEKFMLLSLLSEMLKNGVSLKISFKAAVHSTLVPSISKQFNTVLERLSRGEKHFWEIDFFEPIEQSLLAGAGNITQLGDMLGQFSDRSRLNALTAATNFFRMITIMAILLLAFAVFVEFFTIVLTQVLIQQEFINAAEHA
ncbi:MAG: type II secretion system F family protein [Sulfuricurvum sp.]|nr:type II secretion system F family protein [Sulfuricurvum sp.]MDP3022515.1 type II secretion system F family protein [Sulfuricurvum sp.]